MDTRCGISGAYAVLAVEFRFKKDLEKRGLTNTTVLIVAHPATRVLHANSQYIAIKTSTILETASITTAATQNS